MKTSSQTAASEGIAGLRNALRHYYYLTKPGIIRGNLLTAGAGFLLAAQGTIVIGQLVAMLVGLALIIAAGCVCNNYLDRGIDLKMARTSKRALVTGAIANNRALTFAAALGVSGAVILVLGCNWLTAALAVFGFVAYVALYGWAKRRTTYGTVIGSISGAVPPLVGYAAVAGRLDVAALLLFLVLVSWQMPHFYAIAIYRHTDYKAAGIPVLPVVKGFIATKRQMALYAIVFTVAVASLAMYGPASDLYGILMVLAGSLWLLHILSGWRQASPDLTIHWARRVFGSSLLVLTFFCLTLGIDSFVG